MRDGTLFEVPLDRSFGLIDRYAHGDEVDLVTVLLVGRDHFRLELLAILAPGRPKLEQGWLPTNVLREIDGVSIEVFDDDSFRDSAKWETNFVGLGVCRENEDCNGRQRTQVVRAPAARRPYNVSHHTIPACMK
jgi:hypothetical protein